MWVWTIPDHCKSISTTGRDMLRGDLDILVTAILAADPKTTTLRSLQLDEYLTEVPSNLANALMIMKARGVPIVLTTKSLTADACAKLIDTLQIEDLQQKKNIVTRIQMYILSDQDEECPVEDWSSVLQEASNMYLKASPGLLLQHLQQNTLKSFTDQEAGLYTEKKRLAKARKEALAIRDIFPSVCACIPDCQKITNPRFVGSHLANSDPNMRYDPNFR